MRDWDESLKEAIVPSRGNSHQWEGFFSHQWDQTKFSPVGKKLYPTGKKKIIPTGEKSYEKKFSPVGRKWRKWRKGEEEGGKGPLLMLLGQDYGLKGLT